MKNLALFIASMALGATLASPALACTYYINQIEKKNELMAASASLLKVSLEDTKQLEVRGFSFYESKPTPMCPAEMTYKGVVSMTYMDTTALRPTQCSVVLEVKKIEDWVSHIEQYEFDSAQPACTILE